MRRGAREFPRRCYKVPSFFIDTVYCSIRELCPVDRSEGPDRTLSDTKVSTFTPPI